MQYTVSSPEQMIELAEKLVQSGYKKFGLRGELGAGKTHFTKGIARGLGLDQDEVHSPTYVYFHEYNNKATKLQSYKATVPEEKNIEALKHGSIEALSGLLHVDMYRMTDLFQIIKIGLEDKLNDYEYRAIEWPHEEFIAHHKDIIIVDIEIKDQYNRLVTLTI